MRTKEAAEKIGVSQITLKRWLIEGKVADVRKDRNGWRVFNESDIQRILAYKESGVGQVGEAEADYGEEIEPLRVCSFFSGIGGFELGFERAGFKTVFQCEINKFCLHLLNEKWPKVPRSTNIKEIANGTAIPPAEVWVGGFPCQDVSLARMGKRDGLRGQQSGLFHEFARLLGEGRPRVFVIENVHGLLNSHSGRDFRVVVSTLAQLGYSVGWRTFNSQHFGVPQSRRRVFIVGCYRDGRGPGRILFEPERSDRDASENGQNGAKSISPFKEVLGEVGGSGPIYQRIAYCLYACSARHTGTDWSRTYVSYPRLGKVRRLTAGECEGIMGFPKGWSIPQSTNGFKDRDIESFRYYALGNAVTPPVAEWIGRRVASYLKSTVQI